LNAHKKTIATIGAAVILAAILITSAVAQESLPVDKAGTIGEPAGRLAFVREGNVYVMNVDGSGQEMVCQIENANGRLSWSPDGKQIVFTRSGKVEYQAPATGEGGIHKLYDLFLVEMDSVYANRSNWWVRLTDDMGSRGPEWSADGTRIVFYKDLNANKVNALSPNYQICTMAPDGSDMRVLRPDRANPGESFLISPTMSSDGALAAVFFQKLRPVGLVVMKPGEYSLSMDSLEQRARKMSGKVAPAWSPDGKWLAYVDNDMNNGGLYITTADLKERYLVTAPPVGTYLYTVAPSFSPDSKWITFSTTDGSIWIVDITGNGRRRLSGPGLDQAPAWSK
jgi:Tol biopolymer transport system component